LRAGGDPHYNESGYEKRTGEVPSANLSIARSTNDKTLRRLSSPTTDRDSQSDRTAFGILIATGSSDVARTLSQWAAARRHLPLVATTVDQALALAREHHPEVLAVDLLFGDTGSEGIALGIELLKAAPRAEVVFLAESMDLPEVHAANDIGISRLVAVRDLPLYLASALEPLADLSRARRRLDEAQRAVDRVSYGLTSPSPSSLPLPIAERRFRESHVRACLAKAGGRRAAAQLLGVPYTTFCVMLRKLGIAPDANPSP
jgi:hypothetical protein